MNERMQQVVVSRRMAERLAEARAAGLARRPGFERDRRGLGPVSGFPVIRDFLAWWRGRRAPGRAYTLPTIESHHGALGARS